jgi:heat shock protein HtpX
MLVFGFVGLLINFGSYWFSDRIALLVHRAQPVSAAELPGVYAIVRRLVTRAGMPMPRIYVIPSDSPNAFATGRNPAHAAVAVTQGILTLLNERELEGVLAHELSHVKNRDILIASIAAAIAGLIAAIGHVLQWGFLLGGGARNDEDRGGGALSALAWIIVAPIVALLLQMAISRSREYGADASGAALCGNPKALADALSKLERESKAIPYEFAGPATAHLFIVNPLQGAAATLMNLLSTHPPILERIARLQKMQVERA